MPNVRFLYIDTDPNAAPTVAPDDPAALAPREVVIARLNRPGPLPPARVAPAGRSVDAAGEPLQLARTPGAANGVRAFGRLALFDNYRLDRPAGPPGDRDLPDRRPADQGRQGDRPGLRTNRPRAYVIAGLAGGTGGGMFLDLAYLIRHELRQVGYLQPEVVGLFFVPPADKRRRATPPGQHLSPRSPNCYHFQAKRSRYQTSFDKSEAPVIDPEPPFARVAVLPFPPNTNPKDQAARRRERPGACSTNS